MAEANQREIGDVGRCVDGFLGCKHFLKRSSRVHNELAQTGMRVQRMWQFRGNRNIRDCRIRGCRRQEGV